MLQIQGETLHAAVAAGQVGGEVGGQAPQREQQRLVGFDVEVQFQAFIEHIRWLVEVQRERAVP